MTYDPIVIIDYQSRWREEFEEIGARLREALDGLALQIDHIGSTAIPGLASKDIIDVQVTVEKLAMRSEIESALEGEWIARGEGVDHVPFTTRDGDEGWTKLFFREKKGRRIHVHVRQTGAPNQRYPLLFRDYLRQNPEAAFSYGVIKRRIADLPLTSREEYVLIKDGVCDLIFLAAEDWAKTAGWSPMPSDS